jgi:curved DNA-binding protein CbpA
VSDHFAELGLLRRAWIDAEEVKLRHHALMAESHPDKSGGDGGRASRLNEARRVLENPASRLRHLLELEFPGLQSVEKPQPDWDLFSRTGELARFAREVASKRDAAASPSPVLWLALAFQKSGKSCLVCKRRFRSESMNSSREQRACLTLLRTPNRHS